MGLDMYLYATKYESWSEWNEFCEEEIEYPIELKELEDMNKKRNFLSVLSKYQVGYWRNFNTLHNYIVQNFNGGEENCKEIYLSEDALKQILKVCKEVLEDLKTCKEVESGLGLLPPSSGFQKIDELYKKELEYTVELLEKCLKVKKVKFYYRGSW